MSKHTPGELGDISVLDCGCRAITYTDSPWPDLEYCPMHKAAPDMLAALEATQRLLDDVYSEDIISSRDLYEVYEKNKQALAATEATA